MDLLQLLTTSSLKFNSRASKISKISGEMLSDSLFSYTNFQKPPLKNPRSATALEVLIMYKIADNVHIFLMTSMFLPADTLNRKPLGYVTVKPGILQGDSCQFC